MRAWDIFTPCRHPFHATAGYTALRSANRRQVPTSCRKCLATGRSRSQALCRGCRNRGARRPAGKHFGDRTFSGRQESGGSSGGFGGAVAAARSAHRRAVANADPTCGATLLADQCCQILAVMLQGLLAYGEARRGGSPYVALVCLMYTLTLALMLALPHVYWQNRLAGQAERMEADGVLNAGNARRWASRQLVCPCACLMHMLSMLPCLCAPPPPAAAGGGCSPATRLLAFSINTAWQTGVGTSLVLERAAQLGVKGVVGTCCAWRQVRSPRCIVCLQPCSKLNGASAWRQRGWQGGCQ